MPQYLVEMGKYNGDYTPPGARQRWFPIAEVAADTMRKAAAKAANQNQKHFPALKGAMDHRNAGSNWSRYQTTGGANLKVSKILTNPRSGDVQYDLKPTHISLVRAGDVILRKGKLRTLSAKNIKRGGMGITIFGDSYRLGTDPVMVAKIKHAKPKKTNPKRNPLKRGDMSILNNRDREYFVLVPDGAGGWNLQSAWDYREDAQDAKDELIEDGVPKTDIKILKKAAALKLLQGGTNPKRKRKKNPANWYIATDRDRTAIYGVGDTAAEAKADARRYGARGSFVTLPATKQLIDKVQRDGGNIAWDEVDGYATTVLHGSRLRNPKRKSRVTEPSKSRTRLTTFGLPRKKHPKVKKTRPRKAATPLHQAGVYRGLLDRSKSIRTKDLGTITVHQLGHLIFITNMRKNRSIQVEIPYASVEGASRAYKNITSRARMLAVLHRHGFSV